MPAKTHGLSRSSREHKVWTAMKQRCLNPKDKAYAQYGGRGIAVCKEWQDDFEAFLKDVGFRPSSQHSIERIDNNKGYEPQNVCWATKDIQMHNRRAHGVGGIRGVYRNGTRWMSRIHRGDLDKYLGTFSTKEEAHKAYQRAEAELYG